MSAYMVGKAHIDYLLSAGMSRSIIRLQGATLHWTDTHMALATTELSHPEGVAIPAEPLDWYWAHKQELTRATADRVGAMLLAENQRSVNHRYAEDDIEYPYIFQEVRGPFDPVEVIKALHGYRYQACEHPDFWKSEAAQFVDALLEYAIDALPGYDQADTWSVNQVQYEEGISLTDLARRKR